MLGGGCRRHRWRLAPGLGRRSRQGIRAVGMYPIPRAQRDIGAIASRRTPTTRGRESGSSSIARELSPRTHIGPSFTTVCRRIDCKATQMKFAPNHRHAFEVGDKPGIPPTGRARGEDARQHLAQIFRRRGLLGVLRHEAAGGKLMSASKHWCAFKGRKGWRIGAPTGEPGFRCESPA